VIIVFYTIYHTQAYTLPLPLNPINHQAIYYWYLHSYTPFCGMWAMCVNVVFIIHTILQWLLFVISNCAIDFVHVALCRSCSYMDCLFSFYARPYVIGRRPQQWVSEYVLCNFHSCNGVRMSHWMKGYLTWLDAKQLMPRRSKTVLTCRPRPIGAMFLVKHALISRPTPRLLSFALCLEWINGIYI